MRLCKKRDSDTQKNHSRKFKEQTMKDNADKKVDTK